MNLQDQIIMTIEWAGERMEQLNEEGRLNDLYCIYEEFYEWIEQSTDCLLYTSPSPRDRTRSRMPSSA